MFWKVARNKEKALTMLPCSDIKVKLSQDELHSFELFISGRNDPAIVDSSDSSDQENYICPCGKTFKTKTPYQRHMDIAHATKSVSYRCNVCGKTFGKKCTLTMHMSIHGTEDRKAFDSMEQPSTRSNKLRTVATVSSSSPLKEKITDIAAIKENKLSFDNKKNNITDAKRTTRSSSKDNAISHYVNTCVTQSTSQEKVHHNTRSNSHYLKDKIDTIPHIKSESIKKENDVIIAYKDINLNTVKPKINSICSEPDLCSDKDNNNVVNYSVSNIKSENTNEQTSTVTVVGKGLNNSHTDSEVPVCQIFSSQESDKENTDNIVDSVITNNKEPVDDIKDKVLNSVLPIHDNNQLSSLENSNSVNIIQSILQSNTSQAETKNVNSVIKSTNKAPFTLQEIPVKKTSGSQEKSQIAVVKSNQRESHPDAKSTNPQTIVIVIREAKRLGSEQPGFLTTSKSISSVVPVSCGKTTTSLSPTMIQSIVQKQRVMIENNNLIKSLSADSNLNKPIVSRTVASVAPSIITRTLSLQKQEKTRGNPNNNMVIIKPEPLERGDSDVGHYSGDGETTESDDGTDEYAPVRKSARLDGKIPTWKKVVEEVEDISHSVDEPRIRKRKVGRPKVNDNNDDIDDGELSGAAEELFGDVAAEMDIDAQEIEDMSSSLFARRPRMYKDEYNCDICGKSFTTEKYLQMHSSLHGASTPARNLVAENYKVNESPDSEGYRSTWTCKICNKSFAQNSSFKNHMRTHSDERPFVCDICCIGFKERYHLKKHMLFKHSDELKEKCQFCGKKFKDSTAVRAHERIHSDHRPYPCRRCGKAFKTSECLWHHENRSKTCGALGGPPLPPLPKKGRISRKNKLLQEMSVELQQNPSLISLKKEEDNMLDLVQQIIHADSSEEQLNAVNSIITSHPSVSVPLHHEVTLPARTTQYSMPTQHFDNHVSKIINNPLANISVPGMVPTTLALSSLQQPQAYIHPVQTGNLTAQKVGQNMTPTAKPLVPNVNNNPKEHHQQMHTVKVNQGQQFVFSVPVLKDGNMDPAAQVTKAILDAISNTTGNMKGNVNIQKTIQCAVNNVQEAFHPVKKVMSPGAGIVAQPKVAIPVVDGSRFKNVTQAIDLTNQSTVPQFVTVSTNNTFTKPYAQSHLNVDGPVPKITTQPQQVFSQSPMATQQQIMNPHVVSHQQMQQPMQGISGHLSQQQPQQQSVYLVPKTSTYATSSSKPYLVSILPPIASVAQALIPQVKTEEPDALVEDDYSTDSGDEDDMEDSIPPAMPVVTESNNRMFTSSVAGGNTRPVAAVQPVRRVEPLDIKPTIQQLEQGVIESTSEPYIVHPTRTKQSNYTCPKCQKGFAVLTAYQKHLLKHEEVRPFRCETCDIGFKLKVHLKKHNLYRHSLDYPCECSICGKRFKDSSAVRLHERIHSEDRPFQCGCGKSFKTKENLWGHQNRKMCPFAGYPPPSNYEANQYYNDTSSKDTSSPIHAHARLEDGGVTAHASVKSVSNKIIAEAVVSNKHVTAQATIDKNGEVTAHASVIPIFDLSTKRYVEKNYRRPVSSPVVSVNNNNNKIPVTDHKAILKTDKGEIHCTVSLPSSNINSSSITSSSYQSQLPSFETFARESDVAFTKQQHLVTSASQGVTSSQNVAAFEIKKESIADQCPTIQNLLKRGPRTITKLPGIQQLFKQHIKPPPPYPGHVTPPRYSDNSSYSSGGSPVSSPTHQHGIPSSPVSSSTSYSRQNSRSPISPCGANLNVMLNPDQLYGSGLTRDPFLRTPPPSVYTRSESYSSTSSDYSPASSNASRSPRISHAVSPAPSAGDGSVPPVIYWDDESERKPVVAQWQQADSDTLFHELSNTMINQL